MPAQGKAGLSFEYQQRFVLVLLAITVEERQLLVAVRGIIGGIDVEHDPLRPPPRLEEQFHQIAIRLLDPFQVGLALLEKNVALFRRLFRFAAGVSVLKTVQGRAAGQRAIVPRRHVAERLKQRIVTQLLSVVAVEVAAQNLVHALRENLLGAVRDELLSPRVRQPPRCFPQHAQLPIQTPHRQQTRIADHRSPGKINRDRLLSQVPKRKLLLETPCFKHVGLLHASK